MLFDIKSLWTNFKELIRLLIQDLLNTNTSNQFNKSSSFITNNNSKVTESNYANKLASITYKDLKEDSEIFSVKPKLVKEGEEKVA